MTISLELVKKITKHAYISVFAPIQFAMSFHYLSQKNVNTSSAPYPSYSKPLYTPSSSTPSSPYFAATIGTKKYSKPNLLPMVGGSPTAIKHTFPNRPKPYSLLTPHMGMDGMSSQLEGELNRIHAETGTVNGLAIKAYAMQLFSDGYNELFVLEVARAMVMCYRYLVDETASKIRVEPDDVHTTVERDGPIRLQLAVLLKSIITKFGGNYNLYHNTISAYQDGENWDIEANTLRGFFITQLRDQSPEALAKIFCRQFNPEQFKEYYKNAKLTGDIYLKTMAAVKAFTAVCLLSAEFPGKVLWDGGYCTVQRAVDLEGMVQRYPPPEQWDPGKTVLTPQGIVDSAALGRPHPDYATPTAQKGKIILQYPHLSISHVHTAYLFSSILCRDNQTSTKDPNILRAEHEFICDLTGCPAHVVEVAPKLNDGPTKK